MGGKFSPIFRSLRLAARHALSINKATASFDEVKTALNGYFAARLNVIVERARFNRRRQNPGESVDTLIRDL